MQSGSNNAKGDFVEELAELPSWASSFSNKYGNVLCKVCGKNQAASFTACIQCCKHDELNLTEEWRGPDDGGGWELDVECAICGKNFGFMKENLVENYKVVRKKREKE